jgi:hypothetical protein
MTLIVTSSPAFAAKGRRGASDTAYEHASERAVFHRVSDWFATVGKSEEEKAEIIEERQIKRAEKQAQKEAEKAKKKAAKEAKKAGKKAKKQHKGSKKGGMKGPKK